MRHVSQEHARTTLKGHKFHSIASSWEAAVIIPLCGCNFHFCDILLIPLTRTHVLQSLLLVRPLIRCHRIAALLVKWETNLEFEEDEHEIQVRSEKVRFHFPTAPHLLAYLILLSLTVTFLSSGNEVSEKSHTRWNAKRTVYERSQVIQASFTRAYFPTHNTPTRKRCLFIMLSEAERFTKPAVEGKQRLFLWHLLCRLQCNYLCTVKA